MPSSDLTKNSKLPIEITDTKFKFASFTTDLQRLKRIRFDVIKMNNSLFIWIGDKDNPIFSDLSLSMSNNKDNKIPLKTKIIGANEESLNFSVRLCKKLNKQVYLSLNIESDTVLPVIPVIEKILYIIVKQNPDCF